MINSNIEKKGYSQLIRAMYKAAATAASYILQKKHMLKKINIYKKGLNDFVTDTDRKAEHIIIKSLRSSFPDYSFLTEERGAINNNLTTNFRWIIDPIDGTFNYMHDNPNFAISIALEQKKGNIRRIIAGLIHLPLVHQTFWAEKGKGAYYKCTNELSNLIQVTKRRKLENLLIGINSLDSLAAKKEKYILKCLGIQNTQVRISGSTAIDLAYIASGKLDFMLHIELKPWDIAAGILLVQEAGGIITDIQGNACDINTSSIIATNKPLFKKMKL